VRQPEVVRREQAVDDCAAQDSPVPKCGGQQPEGLGGVREAEHGISGAGRDIRVRELDLGGRGTCGDVYLRAVRQVGHDRPPERRSVIVIACPSRFVDAR
jgi:hypothetical protein